MSKFLSSKIFVFISTFSTFLIGVIAGWLLGYQPYISGYTSGVYIISGSTDTEYVFQIKTAFGYWLLTLLITLVVLFLCIIIRKLYINRKTSVDNEK